MRRKLFYACAAVILALSRYRVAAASYWNFPSGVATVYDSDRSLNLGGTDECVTIPDNVAFTNNTFCIGFDVKAAAQAPKVLFSHYDYGTNNMAWSVWSGGAGNSKLEFIVSDSGQFDSTHTKDYTSSVTFLDSTWHSVKMCFNGPAHNLRIWKDNVEDTTPSKALDPAISAVFNSTVSVGIGCDHSNGTTTRADFFVGRFDRVWYANQDLSATNMGTGSAKIDLSGVTGVTDLLDIKSTDSSTSIANISSRNGTGRNLEATDIDTDI